MFVEEKGWKQSMLQKFIEHSYKTDHDIAPGSSKAVWTEGF
jgi:hypothetical protein